MKNPVPHFYDHLADHYDQEQETFAFVRVPEKKIIENELYPLLKKTDSLLEIGAGTGRFTLPISERTAKVTALDISEKMLAQLAKKQCELKESPSIQTFLGDFLSTDFNETFDAVVSFSALEYIKDKEALFAKLEKTVTPGGLLFFTTAHRCFFRLFGQIGNYFRQKIYMNAYGKKELKRILDQHGFRIIRMQDEVLKTPFSKGILLYVLAEKI